MLFVRERYRRAVRFIRKTHGLSQCAVVIADDGLEYVLKWSKASSNYDKAINEAIGTSLYHALGLPVPTWVPIRVTQSFIDANRGMWMEGDYGSWKPKGGIHFASANLVSTHTGACTFIPIEDREQVVNRVDFWGAFVVDTWCEETDRRQVIFVRDSHCKEYRAMFIDHDQKFGGTLGKSQVRWGRQFYNYLDVYRVEHPLSHVDIWISRIEQNGEAMLASLSRTIPKEWSQFGVNVRLSMLRHRILELKNSVFAHIRGEYRLRMVPEARKGFEAFFARSKGDGQDTGDYCNVSRYNTR